MMSTPPYDPADKEQDEFYAIHEHRPGEDHFPAATDTTLGTDSTVLIRDTETGEIYDVGSEWDTTADILSHIDADFPERDYQLGVPAEVMVSDGYGTCELCEAEMEPGVGCADNKIIEFGDDKTLEALRHGQDGNGFAGQNCPDCNAAPGEKHHPGCDREICPQCHRQLLSCQCADVVHVIPAEQPSI
ncbi:hypothetical protein [Salinibaculum rarum]|uniref:hypothetical protein n=1 Tax=Salinibaculum rarum TaxID=3058903 RepID=UPI0026600BDE|nr:hypothetical protein [Salinibaculum sp. KK48]